MTVHSQLLQNYFSSAKKLYSAIDEVRPGCPKLGHNPLVNSAELVKPGADVDRAGRDPAGGQARPQQGRQGRLQDAVNNNNNRSTLYPSPGGIKLALDQLNKVYLVFF